MAWLDSVLKGGFWDFMETNLVTFLLLTICAMQVFPTEYRTLGSSLCVSLAIVANAANAELYPLILETIGK